MAFSKDASDSDSFDMFTDSEASDNEWIRASIDVRTLPPDTTTTNDAPMMKHLRPQHMPFNTLKPQPVSRNTLHQKPPIQKDKRKGKKKRKRSKKKTQKSKQTAEHMRQNRTKAILELISTETSYVSQLEKVLKFYARKLEHNKKMMSATDFNVIFPCIVKMTALHEQLLKSIRKRYTTYTEDHQWIIWDILISFVPNFEMYQVYVRNIHTILHTIRKCLDNPKLYTFHQKQKKQFNNLTLTDLIVLPVYRVMRYKILIQDLVQQTHPSHPDSIGLQQTLRVIADIITQNKDILQNLNARVSILNITNEIRKAPDLVSASRQFVFAEELYTIKLNGKTAKYIFYLFNDCLIYCAVSKHGSKCVFKMRLPIDAAFAVQPVHDMKKYKNVFAIYSSLESFMVTTKTNTELKTKWIAALNSAISVAQNSHYFHTDRDKALMGRGSVLIRQAPLAIPKYVQKHWTKLYNYKKQTSTLPLNPVRTQSYDKIRPKHRKKRMNRSTLSTQPPPLPSGRPPRRQSKRPLPPTPSLPPFIFKTMSVQPASRRRSSIGASSRLGPQHYKSKTMHAIPEKRRRSSYGGGRSIGNHTRQHTVAKSKRRHRKSKSNAAIAESKTDLVICTMQDWFDKAHAIKQTQQSESISIAADKSPNLMMVVIDTCTDCGAAKEGKTYEEDGCFYCNECWNLYNEEDAYEVETHSEEMNQMIQRSMSMKKIESPLTYTQRDVIMRQMQQQSMSVAYITPSQSKHTKPPEPKTRKAPPPPPPSKRMSQQKKLVSKTVDKAVTAASISFDAWLDIAKQAVSGVFEDDTIGNCVLEVLEEGFETKQEILDDLEQYDQCTIIPDACCDIQYGEKESQLLYQILQKIFRDNVHDIAALINEFAKQIEAPAPALPSSLLECTNKGLLAVSLIVTQQINQTAKRPIAIDNLTQFITEQNLNGEALTQMDARQFLNTIKPYNIKSGKGRQLFNGILNYWTDHKVNSPTRSISPQPINHANKPSGDVVVSRFNKEEHATATIATNHSSKVSGNHHEENMRNNAKSTSVHERYLNNANTTGDEESKPDVDILTTMRLKASSRQNLLKNRSYDAYKVDTDGKTIWNAYMDQHGEEPGNEWSLHAFIKAQPQLPSKTFRQARGMFRAFKGSGRV